MELRLVHVLEGIGQVVVENFSVLGKREKRKGPLFKCLVVLALEH